MWLKKKVSKQLETNISFVKKMRLDLIEKYENLDFLWLLSWTLHNRNQNLLEVT